MTSLTSDQRNSLYLQEAVRAGIHKPILAALHRVHHNPVLSDGETGLGISPKTSIALNPINSLTEQVRYAANTVRSLTNDLMDSGWQVMDFWDSEKGWYADKFIRAIAAGYTAPISDPTAAVLESTDAKNLMQAYQADSAIDFAMAHVPANQAYLDQALLSLVEQLSHHYLALDFQRHALLEMVRLWLRLDDREIATTVLEVQTRTRADPTMVSEFYLDLALLRFVRGIAPNYSSYPHQREALLRLTQLWRQLDSREAAIASLAKNTSPAPDLNFVDPPLMALVQQIPYSYQAKGVQRNALVEGFRLWQQLETRSAALVTLGVNPEIFSTPNPQPSTLQMAASQLDRALLDFVRHIPNLYQTAEHQREALLHLVQLWRGIATQEQTVPSLVEDLKRTQTAHRDSQEAPPTPIPGFLPAHPDRWTLDNIQLFAAIRPNGSLTWAEATHGGIHMPPNQATVDAITGIAERAEQIRDRLGRPFRIIHWYHPAAPSACAERDPEDRHAIGDAIDFYCEGFTADQLYWFLDPWWTGGLCRYRHLPYVVYIDGRRERARGVKERQRAEVGSGEWGVENRESGARS
ncbi:peptidase M15A [Kovacikia minuta CCNUW1]|uniref:peptidase M15A n=1 Tax=Kovacikia minuta TaxID=2931930 RepID=UPI001CCA46F7|nr:peptidase M15A [Kovacikia minuta]UBF23651.1 peptidase M15A [Kovacikia minuta CCNUW1]